MEKYSQVYDFNKYCGFLMPYAKICFVGSSVICKSILIDISHITFL